jgi:hypothetical protein
MSKDDSIKVDAMMAAMNRVVASFGARGADK